MAWWALLRKDWNVYRVAVVGGALLAGAPYAVLLAMQVTYPPAGGNTYRTYGRALEQGATAGLMLTLVVAAVFGGVAFAAERRERSAEFLALLPVRRWRTMLSKLLVAVACLAAGVAVHLYVGVIGSRWRESAAAGAGFSFLGPLWPKILVVTCVALLFFGVAWMLSVYLPSPGVAAAVGIGVAAALLFVTNAVVEASRDEFRYLYGPGVDAEWISYMIVSPVVGGLALVVSSAHYLVRVRP